MPSRWRGRAKFEPSCDESSEKELRKDGWRQVARERLHRLRLQRLEEALPRVEHDRDAVVGAEVEHADEQLERLGAKRDKH